MFSILLILEALGVHSLPEAEYQIFPGFDLSAWSSHEVRASEAPEAPDSLVANEALEVHEALEDPKAPKDGFKPPPKLKKHSSVSKTEAPKASITTTHPDNQTIKPNLKVKFSCPEEEKPSNIGPYEVPTQRDLVLLAKKTLHMMYGSYHEKTMIFLEHITKATRATKEVERKCLGNKSTYRQCVKHVSSKCETITKSLTSSLELQRQDVLAFGEDDVCNLNDMKEDPMKLIKTMASEEASLEFALPGFLRLLNACSAYCLSPLSGDYFKARKPSRHLTDTDVVIRHFLTRKHYARVLPNKVKPKIKLRNKTLK